MNAVQITAEIDRLSALLPAALLAEDFDGDVAAVLRHLGTALKHTATSFGVVADAADNSDGPGWDTVVYEAGRAYQILPPISDGVLVGAKAAKTEQAVTAAHLARIFAETRGSRFFDALANLPGSATAV